jgi:hypothetical protein
MAHTFAVPIPPSESAIRHHERLAKSISHKGEDHCECACCNDGMPIKTTLHAGARTLSRWMQAACLFTIASGLVQAAGVPSHPDHALYFSPDGFPIAPAQEIYPGCIDGDKHHRAPIGWAVISKDCFESKYIPLILNGIKTSTGKSVVVFIHGGLNSLAQGRARVDQLLSAGSAPGAITEKHYPIFINWQASLFSSYIDHLVRVRSGLNQPPVAAATSPFIFAKDIGVGAARVLPDTFSLLFDEYDSHAWFSTQEYQPVVADCTLVKSASCQQPAQGAVEVRRGCDVRTSLDKFEAGIIEVPWLPVKPLTTGILLDGMGSEAWKIMKRRTELMFHREIPEDRLQAARDGTVEHEEPQERSLGFFLQTLARSVDSLDMVGHSAGALILNRALREVPELPVKRIVYMAAAASEEDYEITLLGDGTHPGYLGRHDKTLVYHLLLHPQAERSENDLQWFAVAPDGSLLHWIDAFLSDPQYLRQRMAGKASNLAPRIGDTPPEVLSRVFVKVFDFGVPLKLSKAHGSALASWYSWCSHDTRACQPQRHGDFSEMPFWEDWFVKPDTLPEATDRECRRK